MEKDNNLFEELEDDFNIVRNCEENSPPICKNCCGAWSTTSGSVSVLCDKKNLSQICLAIKQICENCKKHGRKDYIIDMGVTIANRSMI